MPAFAGMTCGSFSFLIWAGLVPPMFGVAAAHPVESSWGRAHVPPQLLGKVPLVLDDLLLLQVQVFFKILFSPGGRVVLKKIVLGAFHADVAAFFLAQKPFMDEDGVDLFERQVFKPVL